MENNEWIWYFREERERNGISRKAVAAVAGISREYLCRLETGKLPVTDKTRKRLAAALKTLYPDPLNLMIDYVRIRFPTMDARHIIEDVLRLKMKYMAQEDHGLYSYSSMYVLGDVVVMTSPKEENGVLLELKGKGCRQFEAYLDGQQRSWYEFFRQCLDEDAVFKRIDLAVNDRAGILDIPYLCDKCDRGECISVFRSFKAYRTGGLAHLREENKESMGATLYIGSMQSDLYFCIYEKAYEQLVKKGIPVEDAEVKNRFEIRLKNDRAYFAVYDLVSNESPEDTAFGIINRYVRFVDRDSRKSPEDWPLNHMWSVFIGEHRDRLKLTTDPEPYSLEKTLNWLSHQVAPSWKMLLELDRKCGTNIMEEMLAATELADKHRKIIEQKLQEIGDVVITE